MCMYVCVLFYDRGGVNTPASLADKINSMPPDSTLASGYSLIPVHVWSMKFDDVVETISLLDKQGVRVLGVQEYIQAVAQNIKPQTKTKTL